jgi:hypothetical protein
MQYILIIYNHPILVHWHTRTSVPSNFNLEPINQPPSNPLFPTKGRFSHTYFLCKVYTTDFLHLKTIFTISAICFGMILHSKIPMKA